MFTSINKSVQISTVPFLPALSQKIVVNSAEVPYAGKLARTITFSFALVADKMMHKK